METTKNIVNKLKSRLIAPAQQVPVVPPAAMAPAVKEPADMEDVVGKFKKVVSKFSHTKPRTDAKANGFTISQSDYGTLVTNRNTMQALLRDMKTSIDNGDAAALMGFYHRQLYGCFENINAVVEKY